ncbi:MAG: hypothetical protein N2445_07810, partial [Acidobacteria bacterium]|nr:hypothetical protein [Acidobacteriota bacterium]
MAKKGVGKEFAKALYESYSPSVFNICAKNALDFGEILKSVSEITKVLENPAISKEKKLELVDLIGKTAKFDA